MSVSPRFSVTGLRLNSEGYTSKLTRSKNNQDKLDRKRSWEHHQTKFHGVQPFLQMRGVGCFGVNKFDQKQLQPSLGAYASI